MNRNRTGSFAVAAGLAVLLLGSVHPTSTEAAAVRSDTFLEDAQAALSDYQTLIPDPPPPAEPLQGPHSRFAGLRAGMVVRCMPGSETPFGIDKPYTWVGRELLLWGRVDGGAAPYTFEWDPGDGSASITGTVTNVSYIYAYHTYTTAGLRTATLTVTDDVGAVATCQVEHTVVSFTGDSHERQIRTNAAIQDGLRYLYLYQNSNGSWDNSPYATGAAVAAFELQGHIPANDPGADIYAEFVLAGLEYMFTQLKTSPIYTQHGEDPDTNANGVGIYSSSTVTRASSAYSQGIMMLGLAASRNPTGVAVGGPAGIAGETYEKILTDMVDQLAFSQSDSGGGRGGWRYHVEGPYNTEGGAYSSDNSAVQWASIGLAAAETPNNLFSITVPEWVKDELDLWLTASSCSNGGYDYTSPSYGWCNLAKTGSGLFSLLWLEGYQSGNPLSARADSAVDFINTHWCDSYDTKSGYEQFNRSFYSLYANKKPLDDFGIELPGRNWEADYQNHLVKTRTTPCGSNSYHQNTDTHDPVNDGNWNHSLYRVTGSMRTSFALLILIPGAPGCGTVCSAFTVTPTTVLPETEVCMDASSVFTTCAGGFLTDWRWDFDASDGVDFDIPDAIGETVCNSAGYMLPAGEESLTVKISLQVTDDSAEICTASHDVLVNFDNHCPVPCLNGPFTACVGDTIHLDACCSFDPDGARGDSIVEYQWDLDGDGVVDITSETCLPDTALVFEIEYSTQVSLWVVDTFGCRSPNAGATFAWSSYRDLSIAPGDITLNMPLCVCEGDSVGIAATAHVTVDAGQPNIASMVMRMYYDVVDDGHRICDSTFTGLANGDMPMFVCNWVAPDCETHTVFVVADADEDVRECVETDNIASRSIPGCGDCTPRLVALNDIEQSVGVDELLTIDDLGTGVGTMVGSLGDNFLNTEAMTVLSSCFLAPPTEAGVPDRIFAIDDNRLLEIDHVTGAGTEIGPVGFPDIDGMAFDPATGILYGVTYSANQLISIDIGTGAGTLVAGDVIHGRHLNAIAFHPTDGRAFVLTETQNEWRVYNIDLATGDMIERWVLSGASSMESLVWSLDGSKLYSAADRDGFKDLVTIELLDDGSGTGIATFVSAEHSGFADIEALSWMNLPPGNWRFGAPPSTAIPEGSGEVSDLDLLRPIPNPFNGTTSLAYAVRNSSGEKVQIGVYNASGRRVKTLVNAVQPNGRYEALWDGRDAGGAKVASGVYFYRVAIGTEVVSRRVVVLR